MSCRDLISWQGMLILATVPDYHIEAETKWPPFHGQNLKCIFLNENIWISIKVLLKFVSKGQINNIPALIQIMAWRIPGDKPLSELMMVSLPTDICVTRPQWVNMLNWVKDYKRCTYILYHILEFVPQKKTRHIMEQPSMLPTLYCQYQSCSCPGNFRSQGIIRHGIDLQSRYIPSPASDE